MIWNREKKRKSHISHGQENIFQLAFGNFIKTNNTTGSNIGKFLWAHQRSFNYTPARFHLLFCHGRAKPRAPQPTAPPATTRCEIYKKKQYEERSTEASVELFMTINILEIYDYIFFHIELVRGKLVYRIGESCCNLSDAVINNEEDSLTAAPTMSSSSFSCHTTTTQTSIYLLHTYNFFLEW